MADTFVIVDAAEGDWATMLDFGFDAWALELHSDDLAGVALVALLPFSGEHGRVKARAVAERLKTTIQPKTCNRWLGTFRGRCPLAPGHDGDCEVPT